MSESGFVCYCRLEHEHERQYQYPCDEDGNAVMEVLAPGWGEIFLFPMQRSKDRGEPSSCGYQAPFDPT